MSLEIEGIDRNLHISHYKGENPDTSAVQKLRVGVITSIRDVGASDGNGRFVPTPDGDQYIAGVPEALHQAIEEQGLPIKIAGIVTDDTERDQLDGYAFTPDQAGDWIFARDLGSANGAPLSRLVQNIPSEFRHIQGKSEPERKAEEKAEFEKRVWEAMQEMGAHIMLSDHLMLRAHDLLDETRFGVGKALNIHPAITAKEHPLAMRGKTPTQEAIDNAGAAQNGLFRTGATFHVMNKTIDDGPQLASAAPTDVYSNDTTMALRARNYPTAKIPVVIAGIRYYVDTIYPNLEAIQAANWEFDAEEIRVL